MINPLRPISQNLDAIPISEGNLSVLEIKNLINKYSPPFHNRIGECYATIRFASIGATSGALRIGGIVMTH